MRNAAVKVWLGLSCLAAALMPAFAQKRVALVIGNVDYAVESKLANPENDARLIGRTLRALGFQVQERLNLGKTEMEVAFIRFARDSTGADSAVAYYVGFGAEQMAGAATPCCAPKPKWIGTKCPKPMALESAPSWSSWSARPSRPACGW